MDPAQVLYDMFPYRFTGPRYIECRSGWHKLILEFCLELDTIDLPHRLTFFSIKEKFGRLRIDFNEGYPEEIMKRVTDLEHDFEKRSTTICEICGKPGSLTTKNGWMMTACEDHK